MFVSHDINQVRQVCEKTLWLENSRVIAYGETQEICNKYLEYCDKAPNVNNPN